MLEILLPALIVYVLVKVLHFDGYSIFLKKHD